MKDYILERDGRRLHEMLILRFNPRFVLPIYSTESDGLSFPFGEEEVVTTRVVFAYELAVTTDRSHREKLDIFAAIKTAVLLPVGEPSIDDILAEVKSARNDQPSHLLRFPYDEKYYLEAVLTPADSLTEFPIGPGDQVQMPLTVKRITRAREVSFSPNALWQAVLVPAGENLNGLIVTTVIPIAKNR